MIKLDTQHLFTVLSSELVLQLLADVVTRYEGFFTFSKPAYPKRQADLLFEILKDGYGLQTCTDAIGVEVIDLRSFEVIAGARTDDQWKDLLVGKMLGQAFASTLKLNGE